MGVSRKGRRTLHYKGIEFLWWVGTEEDHCDKIYLNIVSEDKSIVLSYKVGDGCFVVISKGRMFQGHKTSGNWEVYGIPFKEPLMIVTPGDVERIVEWAVDGRGAVPTGIKRL